VADEDKVRVWGLLKSVPFARALSRAWYLCNNHYYHVTVSLSQAEGFREDVSGMEVQLQAFLTSTLGEAYPWVRGSPAPIELLGPRAT
jgi:hypothetical protein